ncbi:MAG: amylo-alpha-1,6-glucosidase [Polyangiaceae bacterium]|nr:amylo-alpha-1,6-glucosidase [Polyangiaceae bacterium]
MAMPSMPLDAADSGEPLELVAARPLEPLVRARGTTFIVTNREGNIAPAGARELGIFFNDSRFLSQYELCIEGGNVAYLSAEVTDDASNQIDLMLGGEDASDVLDDPEHYVHIRRRQLIDEDFVEQITLTNYLRRELKLGVVLAFGADFADIFEVRGSQRARRGEKKVPAVRAADVQLSYRGLDRREMTTLLSFRPAPSRIDGGQARYDVVLAPGEHATIEVIVSVSSGEKRPRERTAFVQRVNRLEDEARQFRSGCARFGCDLGVLQRCLSRSEADLFALRINLGKHAVLAAGIPWFCAPFGRDALLAGYESLLLNPELAVASLRMLAAYQGERDDPYTEEEPGKILHELRFGEMARSGEAPHTPYYGSIDSTPLFVVVAHATYEVIADMAFVEELRPALMAALAWIDGATDEGRRFCAYQKRSPRGLDNQGWKDSKDGVVFPDGRRAVAPIALVEVQGYCADAYRRGAELCAAMGDTAAAAKYAERAARLLALIESELWLPDPGRYAFAVDATGAKLDTVVSNLGHLLWSRVPTHGRAERIADLLCDPASFSGYGIRTLAAGQFAYNPLSYHNGTVWPHDNAVIARGMGQYGFRSAVARIFEGMVASLEAFRDHRLPELFCGMDSESGVLARYPVACSPQAWAAAAPYLHLQSILGITIDAPSRRLFVRDPSLPPSLGRVTIHGMRVGDARVSLRFEREAGRCHVDVLDIVGGEVRTSIELS